MLDARFPLKRVMLVWGVLCGLLILTKLQEILHHTFPDPDDTLRIVQVRDLLAGQSWFDLHQYRIDPPHGTLMHWSRLVDLPLAAVIMLFKPLLGAAGAESVAFVAVPLLTLGVILFCVSYVASRFFDIEHVTFAGLSLGLAPFLLAQTQPMRIDHHGWQIASVMIALLGLLPGRGWKGPALSGLALAFGVTISLELLPVMAGFGAVYALRWLIQDEGRSLSAFLTSLMGSIAVLFLATRGLQDLAVHCDQISPPYMALLGAATLLSVAATALRLQSILLKLAALAIAGLAGVAVFLMLAPQCSTGPFAQLDPLVRHYWYNAVPEGLPAWKIPAELGLPVVASGLIALAVLWHLARSRPAQERGWWLEYLLVTAVAFVAGCLVWRSLAFVGALAAVPLGWLAVRLLEYFRDAISPRRKLASGLGLILILCPAFPVTVAQAMTGEDVQTRSGVAALSDSKCRLFSNAARLNQLPAGTIFAQSDIGPALLEETHHKVIASGHHRAVNAMHDVILAYISPEQTAHAIIRRHHADYVVMCTDVAEPESFRRGSPHGFAANLLKGRAPAWLEPVDLGLPRQLKVWRVKG